MNSSLPDNYSKVDYKDCNKIKLENEKLHDQNKKLITKLEQITCEFSKSQNKIKSLELQNSSTKGINGNLTSILERNKTLEEDNKKLCEEIKFQLDSTKLFEAPVSKILMENNSNNCEEAEMVKYVSEGKLTHLNDQIQELRKQLLKSQQLAYKSECNYKINQIETLEALKNCKLENDSLIEKNLELENKVKNIINLHSENLEMKTILYRSQNDLNVLKSDFDNLKLKQVESTKIFDHEKKMLEKQLTVVHKKNEDLHDENQILLSTIDELTKSEMKNKFEKCSECNKNSKKLEESYQQIEAFELQLQQVQESKSKAEKDFLSQTESFKHFEEEQCKLKEEIKHLNGVKLNFDSSMKLKLNEIDNLTCQLESCSQRLELREQRIDELTKQLSSKVAEERNLKSRIDKVTEKLTLSQDEINKYINDLSEIQKEKERFSENLKNLQQAMTEKLLLVDQLSLKLNETLSANNQLEESLQFHTSSSDTKLRDYANNIKDLTEKLDELNYSINIYENQNHCLESELKETKSKLELSINNEIKIVESHQIEITRYQVQMAKNQELIDSCHSEIKDKDCKINEIESLKNELHLKLLEKNNENEYLSKTAKGITEELSITKKQLLSFTEQMKAYQNNTETIQHLKIKLSKRSNKVNLQENTISELNEKIEVLNQDSINQKKICENLQCKLSRIEKCYEKLKLKTSCSQESLDRKLKALNNVIETNQIEHKQLVEEFHSLAQERDDLLNKLREKEEIIIRVEREIKRHKDEISHAQHIIGTLKDEISGKEKTLNKLEKKVTNLHDYLKCSQLNVVDKSREIDRLEQLVRDRSEQIELRSNQLQEFEMDLEKKLIESQKQMETAKEHEAVAMAEVENLKVKIREFGQGLDLAHQENCKLIDGIKIKEQEYNSVIGHLKKLKDENKIIINKMKSLTNDSETKAMTIKSLKATIVLDENTIDKLTDEMRSKVAILKGKSLQIKTLEDQIKKDKKNFMQTEAELQAQIKLLTRKLNSHNTEKKKEMDNLFESLSNQYQDQLNELIASKKLTETLSANLDEASIKLFEKEEHISELKAQINTQSMVMVDMESKHRLKEAVIERLMQNIDDLTLTNWPNELSGKMSNEGDVMKGKGRLVEHIQAGTNCIYEDVTLEELLTRLNIRLNSDHTNN